MGQEFLLPLLESCKKQLVLTRKELENLQNHKSFWAYQRTELSEQLSEVSPKGEIVYQNCLTTDKT